MLIASDALLSSCLWLAYLACWRHSYVSEAVMNNRVGSNSLRASFNIKANVVREMKKVRGKP